MRCLRDQWGLEVVAARYLPVGFGSHHWEAVSNGARFFVTVDLAGQQDARSAHFDALRAALATASALFQSGAEFIVAPMPSTHGDVVRHLDCRHALSVYPHADGVTRDYGRRLDEGQRRSVIEVLARLHEAPVPPEAQPATRGLYEEAELTEGLACLESKWGPGPFGEPGRRLLARHAAAVRQQLDRRRELAGWAADASRWVVTHGEPHPGNFIETAAGWRLVDWGTAGKAPPERDLCHLDTHDGSLEAAYEQITGIQIQRPLLDLYRLSWHLGDVALFTARLRKAHDDSEEVHQYWTELQTTLTHLSDEPADRTARTR